MHCSATHPHARQHQPAKLPQRAVVVAWHVNQLSALSGKCVQRGNHPVLRLAPGRALLRQPPQVQDVANQVQAPAAECRKEIGQFVGVAVRGTQVHVRYEDRPMHLLWIGRSGHATCSPAGDGAVAGGPR